MPGNKKAVKKLFGGRAFNQRPISFPKKEKASIYEYKPTEEAVTETIEYIIADGRELLDDSLWRDLCIHLKRGGFIIKDNANSKPQSGELLKKLWVTKYDSMVNDRLKIGVRAYTTYADLTDDSTLIEKLTAMELRHRVARNVWANNVDAKKGRRTMENLEIKERRKIREIVEEAKSDTERDKEFANYAKRLWRDGVRGATGQLLFDYYMDEWANRIQPSFEGKKDAPDLFEGRKFFLLYDKDNLYEEGAASSLEHVIKIFGGRIVWDKKRIGSNVLPIVVTTCQNLIRPLARKVRGNLYSPSLIEYCIGDKDHLIHLTQLDLKDHIFCMGTGRPSAELVSTGSQTVTYKVLDAHQQTEKVELSDTGCQTEIEVIVAPEEAIEAPMDYNSQSSKALGFVQRFASPADSVMDTDEIEEVDLSSGENGKESITMELENGEASITMETENEESDCKQAAGRISKKQMLDLVKMVMYELKDVTDFHPLPFCNKVAAQMGFAGKGENILQTIRRKDRQKALLHCFGRDQDSDPWKLRVIQRFEEFFRANRAAVAATKAAREAAKKQK